MVFFMAFILLKESYIGFYVNTAHAALSSILHMKKY